MGVESVQGPVVQSFITLTSSLVLKMLSVPVSTISNSQVFLLKKNANAKATHIFSAKILVYMPYLMITLTNVIVSFEQLGPDTLE